MSKVITFFNHKGGVGKTTLVHNLAFSLADKGQKVLAIDADQQMNLTAAMYGLSTNIDYSYFDENSKWLQQTAKNISLLEYLNLELKNEPCNKQRFRAESKVSTGFVDLIAGDIGLSLLEADLYGVVKNKNTLTRDVPYKFSQSIKVNKKNYDVILIDTSPSASSIINALLVMSSDYFIAPVSPTFFSLQAIDNLSAIFQSWLELLGDYVTTAGFKGLDINVKFLGVIIQLAKRYNGGGQQFASHAEKWIEEVNQSAKKFQEYASRKYFAITTEEFSKIFNDSAPFIIEKCCDFTAKLRHIAEKEGVPVIHLTQDICNKHDKKVKLTAKDGQYKMSFDSLMASYNYISNSLIKLNAV